MKFQLSTKPEANALQQVIKNLRTRVAELEQANQVAANSASSTEAQLVQRMKRVDVELEAQNREGEGLRRELWLMQKSLDEDAALKVQCNRLQGEVTELQDRIAAHARQNEAMARQNDTLTRQNEHATRQNETLTRQNEHVTQQNETLTRQNEHATRQNETLTRQNEHVTQQNETLTRQNEHVTQQKEVPPSSPCAAPVSLLCHVSRL